MARAVPNKKNSVKLTPAQAAQAQSAIQNFLPSVPWPPVTADAKAQMQAAVTAYQTQINQVQKASASQISSGTSGTGAPLPPAVTAAAQNPATLPAAQLAVQQNNIGTLVAGLSSTDPNVRAASSAALNAITIPPTNSVPLTLPKFLPAGTDLNNTSFAQAIQTMQDTVAALEQFAANPTALGAQSARDASLRQYVKNV